MTSALRFLAFWILSASWAFAAGPDDFSAVARADQQRIAATIAGNTDQLSALLADDLHYAYSDGRVQTKAQFLAATASNPVKYLSVVPREVRFQRIAAGAVAMNGVARAEAITDGKRVEFTFRFLAVWREDAEQWKLLAYQSSALLKP